MSPRRAGEQVGGGGKSVETATKTSRRPWNFLIAPEWLGTEPLGTEGVVSECVGPMSGGPD